MLFKNWLIRLLDAKFMTLWLVIMPFPIIQERVNSYVKYSIM